jgi:hypothetical protein
MTSEVAMAMMLSRIPIGIMRKSYRFADQALAALVEAVDQVGPEDGTSTAADWLSSRAIHEMLPRQGSERPLGRYRTARSQRIAWD